MPHHDQYIAIDRTTPCPAAVQPFSSERGRKKRVLWETLVLDWEDHGAGMEWLHHGVITAAGEMGLPTAGERAQAK